MVTDIGDWAGTARNAEFVTSGIRRNVPRRDPEKNRPTNYTALRSTYAVASGALPARGQVDHACPLRKRDSEIQIDRLLMNHRAFGHERRGSFSAPIAPSLRCITTPSARSIRSLTESALARPSARWAQQSAK
jgi:hypothetical protein